MSAGSGTVARREAGQSDPFLRRELRGPVLILARGRGLVFTVLALLMYARWLDMGLAVARHDARLSDGSSFYKEIAIAAAVAAIVQALAWGVLAGFVFWRRSRDLFGIFIAAGFPSVGIICTDLDVIVARLSELEAVACRLDENPMLYLLETRAR
jgi:hypothetical protein